MKLLCIIIVKFWFLDDFIYVFQCNRLDSSESIKDLINNWKINATNESDISKVHNLLHSETLTACPRHFP